MNLQQHKHNNLGCGHRSRYRTRGIGVPSGYARVIRGTPFPYTPTHPRHPRNVRARETAAFPGFVSWLRRQAKRGKVTADEGKKLILARAEKLGIDIKGFLKGRREHGATKKETVQ